MTLIDVICEGRAFSRGWKTPNDRFPLPVVQSLTQFHLRFFLCFLFISGHHFTNKGGEQLEVEQGCCEEPWESAVPPALRLWMWVIELMGTAGLLHKELQGGCALGTGHRGVIVGNPHCSGCPWLEAAPVPGLGRGAAVGTQTLVILVSHLASP